MRSLLYTALLLTTTTAFAQQHHGTTGRGGHEPMLFYYFGGDIAATSSDEKALVDWDLSTWVGNDEHRFKLTTEGEWHGDEAEEIETWALYHRPVDDFWNFEIGVRQDFQPTMNSMAVIGFDGMAKQFFEIGAHAFVDEQGRLTARWEVDTEWMITNHWALEPAAEFNFAAQDHDERNQGVGLTDIEFSLKSRYDLTRKFSPFVEFNYETKVGETAGIADSRGRDPDSITFRLGLHFWF